jgi:hypothetical protein
MLDILCLTNCVCRQRNVPIRYRSQGLSSGGFTPRPRIIIVMLIKEQLDQRITLRLTSSEKAQLIEDANLAQLTVSELIRRRYFGKPILASTDAQTIRELRRMGGLLKHIWNESGATYNENIAPALLAIKQYIEQLAHQERDRRKS